MITGNSALHNIGINSITVPKISVVLKENSYLNTQVIGNTSNTQQSTGTGGAVCFNDLYIYHNSFNIMTLNVSGTFLSNLTAYGMSMNGRIQFLNTGSTLLAFVNSLQGNTYSIYSLSSTGGTLFGNTDIIYQGSSPTLGIAPTGPTRVYALFDIGSSFSSSFAQVYRFDKSGTWTSNALLNNNILVPNSSFGYCNINGARVNEEDILLVACSTNSNSRVNLTGGVKIIRSVGSNGNLFEERELIATDNPSYFVTMSNLGIGSTLLYFAANVQVLNYFTQSGLTFITTQTVQQLIYSSADMLNWSSGTLVPLNFGSITTPYALSAGITDIEYITQGTSSIGYMSSKKVASLDLSGNIIAYSNQNNSRISFSLGNYE